MLLLPHQLLYLPYMLLIYQNLHRADFTKKKKEEEEEKEREFEMNENNTDLCQG